VNHLEKISSGRLSVDGQLVGYREKGGKLYELRESEVAAQRRDIGMVFQRFNLFPHMTALENVTEAPARVKGIRKETCRDMGAALLERVGLGDRIHSYPNQLSGGQQQRVAIARALANEPSVLLADEPTGNLDSRNAAMIFELFASLAEQGHTIMAATHDAGVHRLCSRTVVIGDGEIVEPVASYA
jgi:polar amino acid transport system ATP-binding protein